VNKSIPEKNEIAIMILVDPGIASPLNFKIKAYKIKNIEKIIVKNPNIIPKYRGLSE